MKSFLNPKSKADLEAKTDIGSTALHLAAENGRKAVVALLLQAKAETKATNNYGETPLQYAEQNDKKAVAELLKQAQAVQ